MFFSRKNGFFSQKHLPLFTDRIRCGRYSFIWLLYCCLISASAMFLIAPKPRRVSSLESLCSQVADGGNETTKESRFDTYTCEQSALSPLETFNFPSSNVFMQFGSFVLSEANPYCIVDRPVNPEPATPPQFTPTHDRETTPARSNGVNRLLDLGNSSHVTLARTA